MLSLLITTNVKGATLTDAEYARLRLVFSDLRIATMSDEKAQEYLSYDLEQHHQKLQKKKQQTQLRIIQQQEQHHTQQHIKIYRYHQ